MRAGAISWQLAQTFWVGGLWLLHFVMLPTLEKMGLAPLLIEEIKAALSPLLIGFAAFCVVLQGMVLAQAQGFSSLWRELRGQLLLIVLLMAVAFFAVRHWQPDAERWLQFNYLVLALCGLVLVLQPLPGQRSE
ncbi:DUF4149 domain-containing protein [Pseudomonas sp. F(2018)]|uniref:DUF4149 domain-containing protein n=1 Tax=Pseudomonas sp. F(2018) TaxID=2502240 RepID=UPI0010F80984|nr:DUF4149 domain-containing protein [Pseudomonas sp. F(2018)]